VRAMAVPPAGAGSVIDTLPIVEIPPVGNEAGRRRRVADRQPVGQRTGGDRPAVGPAVSALSGDEVGVVGSDVAVRERPVVSRQGARLGRGAVTVQPDSVAVVELTGSLTATRQSEDGREEPSTRNRPDESALRLALDRSLTIRTG
jgi:hypothetical protein